MSKLRIVILLFSVVVELVLLTLAWVLALLDTRLAERLTHWAIANLKSPGWYLDPWRSREKSRMHP